MNDEAKKDDVIDNSNVEKVKNAVIGLGYGILHLIYIAAVSFTLLFSFNPYHLLILLIIITLDAVCVVIAKKCPLSILEEKYNEVCGSSIRNYMFSNICINFQCNHVYEQQLELLINAWCLVAFKIFFIIWFQLFRIKLDGFLIFV